MIFAAVGTQLPFRRLLTALDDIASRHNLDIQAQSADPGYVPCHIRASPFLEPDEFDEMVKKSSVLVGHAGIGLMLAAQKFHKPIIVYPRLVSLGEHRNDHQLATVRSLRPVPGIYIALDNETLERLLTDGQLQPATLANEPGRDKLVARIRDFLETI